MMINTMSSIRMSYPNLCQQESLEALRLALANKKIFISFYGDSNVGKSTVLNAIMGDRFVEGLYIIGSYANLLLIIMSTFINYLLPCNIVIIN